MIEEFKSKIQAFDIQKFRNLKEELSEKTATVSDYNSADSINAFKELTKTNEILGLYAEIAKLAKQHEENLELVADPDYSADATAENKAIEVKLTPLMSKFELLTATPLENDE